MAAKKIPIVQTDDELRKIISNWTTLNKAIMVLTVKELERAIDLEKNARDRAYILLRLHTRLGKVRSHEGWNELQRSRQA